MDNEEIKKINRVVITQNVTADESGNSIITNDEIYIFRDGEAPIKAKYDREVHGEILADFLEEKGLDLNDPMVLERAEADGIYERYDSTDPILNDIESVYQENLAAYEDVSTDDIDEEDEEIEEDKHLSKKAKAGIAAAVVAGGAIAGVGISHILKNRDKNDDQTEKEYDNEFDKLMDQFDENHPRRLFAISVFDTVEKMNLNTSKDDSAIYIKNQNGDNEYVFSLKEDVSTDKDGNIKQEYLQFTFDEIMAAKLVLNNYTEEQLYEIFGDEQLDSQEIMNNYQSFAAKMQLYYMNAKAPSGVAELIEDETNREWFQKLESTIIDFNKEVNQTNADKVMRTFEYLYEYDVNGTDNVKVNQASINTIKNLGFNMVTGYYNANAASEEFNKYLTIASAPGEYDKQFQTEPLAQVQKGEKLKDILSRAEKGKCTMALVQEQIDSTIGNLQKKQSETNSSEDYREMYRTSLVTVLIDNGNPELASRVLNEDMTDELRNLVEKEGKEAKNALEAYDNSATLNDLPTYKEIKTVADSILGPYQELNLTVIMVNRQRGQTLDLDKDNSNNLTIDEWNKMSKDEQLDYAKENGKVVKTEKKTTQEKVAKEDLTPSEKKEAEKKIEESKKGDGYSSDSTGSTVKVEVDLSTYNGEGAKDGYTWATSGEYTYNGTIVNDINPNAPYTLYSNGSGVLENTYYDIARAAYAYEGVTLNASESDSSIKKALEEDVAEFVIKNKNADAEAIDSYENGWLEGVDSVLKAAVKAGKIERAEAETLYEELKASAAQNSVTPSVEQAEIPVASNSSNEDTYQSSEKPVTDNSDGVYNEDPNLDTDVSDHNFLSEEEVGEGFHISSNNSESYVALAPSQYDGSTMVEETPIVEEAPIVEETPALDSKYYDLIAELTAAELAEQSVAPVDEIPVVEETPTDVPSLRK